MVDKKELADRFYPTNTSRTIMVLDRFLCLLTGHRWMERFSDTTRFCSKCLKIEYYK